MPRFDSYIGIDYSGAQVPEASLKGLRMYRADDGQAPVEVPPPPSPRRYWARRDLAEWLLGELTSDRAVFVGIDHGFSFPLAYFSAHGLPLDWDHFLQDFRDHWPTDEAHTYVDFVRNGSAGRGAMRTGSSRWRRTVEQWAGAKSVFHFDVIGSVAKSTHAGLPWLLYLRRRCGDRVHFWPFDGWSPAAGRSVIAEVYPALWSSEYPPEGRTQDQQDAYAIAAWLQEMDRSGRLGEYLHPDLPAEAREAAAIEGWILGVTDPRGSKSGGKSSSGNSAKPSSGSSSGGNSAKPSSGRSASGKSSSGRYASGKSASSESAKGKSVTRAMGSPQPLTPESIRELSEFLAAPERPKGTLRYSGLRGLLFAIANAPVLQTPSAWFGRVFGDEMEWPNEESAVAVLGTIMSVWNDVVGGSEDGEFEEGWLLGVDAVSDEARAEWSHGFSLGYDLVREDWDELAALFDEDDRRQFDFVQMALHFWSDTSGFYEALQISEAAERETMRKRFEARTLEAAQYYALLGTSIARARKRHSSPTEPLRAERGPGRNDPCPCGSGKKFKKCCMV